MKTYRPLPEYLTIKKSKIEGLGLFAEKDIPKGTYLGISHVRDRLKQFSHDWVRTPLGGFVNHSDEPNCQFIDGPEILYMKTKENIKAGEELTTYYSLYTV